MTAQTWETAQMPAFEPSDQLKAAQAHLKAEKKRAREIITAATHVLYDAMADEMKAKPELGPTELGDYIGYSDGHVRRVVRERGVKPRVDVDPPKRRGRRSSPEPETGQDHDG
jgi:phytoene/squalene synthetase